ncbi:MAG: OmpA family protein [Sphingomonas sp.]
MQLFAALLAGALSIAQPTDGLVTVPCAFQPAFFDIGTARFVESSMRAVENGYLAHFEVFSPSSRAVVTLMGIATDGGSARGNLRLARRRAEALRRFLIARGVVAQRIRIVSNHPDLEGWPLSSTHGRAVVVDVRMPRADMLRLMPRDGPVC